MKRGVLQVKLIPKEAQVLLHPADVGIVDVGLVQILDDLRSMTMLAKARVTERLRPGGKTTHPEMRNQTPSRPDPDASPGLSLQES